MDIKKVLDGGKLTVSVDGRLDTNTAPELQNEIAQLGNVDELVFDFENLVYISSAGLRVLMVAKKGMSDKGDVKVINASDDVKEIFDITGFSSILTIE